MLISPVPASAAGAARAAAEKRAVTMAVENFMLMSVVVLDRSGRECVYGKIVECSRDVNAVLMEIENMRTHTSYLIYRLGGI